MADLESKIAEIVEQAKSYENNGEKITNHSLPELTGTDQYLGRKRAARNPFAALHGAKMSTQGPEK